MHTNFSYFIYIIPSIVAECMKASSVILAHIYWIPNSETFQYTLPSAMPLLSYTGWHILSHSSSLSSTTVFKLEVFYYPIFISNYPHLLFRAYLFYISFIYFHHFYEFYFSTAF